MKSIHVAAHAAGLDDARYRDALQEIAGVRSAKDPHLTRQGFIEVMAYFEGLCNGQLPGFTPGYWFGESLRATPRDSLLVACLRETTALGWTRSQADAFLASEHMSRGRYRRLEDAPAWQLSKMLDGLKAIKARAKAERHVGA